LTVNVLHAGASGLGWAVSAIGVGGFGGALVTAYVAQRERSLLWLQAGLVMSAGVCALGFVPTLAAALPLLFAIGAGTMALLGATNTLIQVLSPDDVRGRALSIYTMIAIGVVPLGALVDGAIASSLGLRATFAIAGAVCTALFLAIWFLRPAVRTV
jgi:predicted MFS family arabinose efflux permease